MRLIQPFDTFELFFSNNLPTFPALTDDYTVQKNIGSMHVGTGKKNWNALKFKKRMVGL